MCTEDLAESLVEKVGCTMIVLDLESSLSVHVETEALGAICRNAFSHMDCEVVLLDCIDDVDLFSAL